MNGISVTHVSSGQLMSELRKKCCGTPKSLIGHGRFYPLLYCLFVYLFYIRSLLMISQAPDYYTEEIKHNSSTGKNRNLFSRVTYKKHQGPIQRVFHNNSAGPWVAHIVISLESGQVCCREPRVCVLLPRLQATWKGRSATFLPPPVNSTDHSLLWPTAIPQGSLTRF